MSKRKSFAPTIATLLIICVLCSGCKLSDIIQPGREEIAGANLLLLDSSVELDIRMDLIILDSITMYYDTRILAKGDTAKWSGQATVFYFDTYFRQVCESVCDSTGSAKIWRGKWVATDNTSPIPDIREWLEKAKNEGIYHTRPVVPAEENDILEGATDKTYCITLPEEEIDWKSFCDANPDMLFGGDSIFACFTNIKVSLFFGAEDLVLDAILLSVDGSDGRWFNMGILPTAVDQELQVDLGGMNLSEGTLSEEWEILNGEVSGE